MFYTQKFRAITFDGRKNVPQLSEQVAEAIGIGLAGRKFRYQKFRLFSITSKHARALQRERKLLNV
jgi:hypothetical protein